MLSVHEIECSIINDSVNHQTGSKKTIKGIYPFNNLLFIYDVRVEKRPHERLGGVLGVSGLAPSARTS